MYLQLKGGTLQSIKHRILILILRNQCNSFNFLQSKVSVSKNCHTLTTFSIFERPVSIFKFGFYKWNGLIFSKNGMKWQFLKTLRESFLKIGTYKYWFSEISVTGLKLKDFFQLRGEILQSTILISILRNRCQSFNFLQRKVLVFTNCYT